MNLQACALKPRAGARRAAEEFLHAGGAPADVGIILGTGLGSLVDRLTQQRTMPSTIGAWIPQSTALGHVGKIVSGSINGKQVVCLQGRVHAYEGFSHEMLGRGVEVLAALGVKKLLVTNASGGLATNLSRGDVIVMQEHLNFVHRGRFEQTPETTATQTNHSEGITRSSPTKRYQIDQNQRAPMNSSPLTRSVCRYLRSVVFCCTEYLLPMPLFQKKQPASSLVIRLKGTVSDVDPRRKVCRTLRSDHYTFS